jgi:hypothetical protein
VNYRKSKRKDAVVFRVGKRELQRLRKIIPWLAAKRTREVQDLFDKRRINIEFDLSVPEAVDFELLAKDSAQRHRVYFGDRVDVPLSTALTREREKRKNILPSVGV